MNRFLVKITAVVLVGLLIITGLICLIGFTIGDKIGVLHAVIFFGLSVLLGGSAVMFIFRNSEYREKLSVKVMLLGIFICLLLFWNGYGWINSLSAANEVKEYNSVVNSARTPYRSFFTEYVKFDNPEGEECEKKIYEFPGDGYESGDKIKVKERLGGFGYPIYEIKKIDKANN